MAGSILGNRVLRKEDPKFLTTGGKYVDDLLDEPKLAGAAHVTYVRSSVAHGRILGIDTSAALALPGVLGIFTAADLGLQVEPSAFNPTVMRGMLAIDTVRFVGEPIAAIVTEDRQQGEDALEQVIVEYDVLEALVDPEAAMVSTTLLYEGAGSNVVFDTMALGMPDNTGDDRSDRLADESHRVDRQHAARHRRVEGRWLDLQPEIGGGEDAEHARQRQRCRRVDAEDPTVGDRRSHVRHMGRAGQQRLVDEIVDVLASGGQEFRVFLAKNPIAENASSHALTPCECFECSWC